MTTKARNEKYLSRPEVCDRYGISRWTLSNWMNRDTTFPVPITLSGRAYWSDYDLAKWEATRGGLDPDLESKLIGLKPCSGVITEYDQLVEALVKRRKELGLSSIELDAKSGVQEGYISKLENYDRPQGRGVGKDSLVLWLGGLKCGIVLVDLPRRPRKKENVSARTSTEISPDFMRAMRRVLAMEPEKQSTVAKLIEASLKEVEA